jgi:ectoine hydroxylase-related dioxygenase (phytanoyl-CoA dioxygenase family)
VEASPYEPLVEAFDREGFVNAGPLFGPEEIFALREDLERYVDAGFRSQGTLVDLPPGVREISTAPGRSIQQLVGLWEVSALYRRLVADPRITSRAAALARTRTLQLWSDQVQYKAALSGGAMTWHQDFLYWGCIQPPIMLTAWLALDDADDENGCMWMVPGSHLWGGALGALSELQRIVDLDAFRETPAWTPPAGAGAWAPPRACPVRAGEVHFHHCVTWHGSPENRSARPRRAFAMHYMPEGVRFTGDTTHPLMARARVEAGGLMLEDPVHFPVVWSEGNP